MTQPYVSQQSQRLTLPAIATAGSNGTATFKFPPPPNGFTFTGTLNCGAAPSSAVFTAAMVASGDAATAGVPWGQWGGNSVYGPVQAWPPESLVVTATGLTAGMQYQLVWLGSVDPLGAAAAISPGTNTSALSASTQGSFDLLGSGTQGGGNGPVTLGPFTAQHAYGSLVLIVGGYSGMDCTATAIRVGTPNAPFHPQRQIQQTGAPSMTFLLPIACAQGDSVEASISSVAGFSATTWTVYGCTAALTQQVITPLANPLPMSQLGGVSKAHVVTTGAGITAALLPPPAVGLVYAIKRIVMVPGAGVTSGLVFGHTSSLFVAYFGGLPWQDTPNGDLWNEGIDVQSGGGTADFYVSYDLIANPTI